FYVPGMVLVGINRVLVAAFYSFKDVGTPAKIGAVNLVVNLGFTLLLMGPLAHGGIALASTIAAVVQAACLVAVFVRRPQDLLAGREVLVALGRALAASAVMGLACWACLPFLRDLRVDGWHRAVLAAAVGAAILLGAAIYFAAARLLGAPEATAL